MKDIYLLLGSNLGDREGFLKQAITEIQNLIGAVIQMSSLYKTASWGKTDEPDYINQVVHIQSEQNAQSVLQNALFIEKKLGRERIEKWGSRVIDIDILFYGDEIIEEENLIIPHPFFQFRRFAVEPMMEIAPDYEHPKLKMTIKSIALELTDELSVQKNIN